MSYRWNGQDLLKKKKTKTNQKKIKSEKMPTSLKNVYTVINLTVEIPISTNISSALLKVVQGRGLP